MRVAALAASRRNGYTGQIAASRPADPIPLARAVCAEHPMPKYAEYVFAAYGLFVVVIGVYAGLLIARSRAARRALEMLDRQAKPPRA